MSKASVVGLVIVAMLGVSSPALALDFDVNFSTDETVEEIWDDWLEIDEYFTMVGPDGETLMQTGRRIYEDDQYLTSDNRLYQVREVDRDVNIAYADWVEDVKLPTTRLSLSEIRQQLGLSVAEAQEEEGERGGRIGVYHTHNAESYVPTDGTHSINGRGGIHAVGAAFAESLEGLGVTVDYAEDLHLPHDRGAYRRSRNTVLDLLSNEPNAIFDVHRDAAPINEYAALIEEEWVTQVQFVVGRQNQNLGVNRQFAQSMKAIADDVYPGLVKGIYFARGNYNQDLSPLNLLLEVGAHTNSRDAAAKGISLFAEVVDFYFFGPREEEEQAGADGAPPGASLAALRSAAGIIVFLAAAGVIYFVVNAGGWKAAIERIKRRLR